MAGGCWVNYDTCVLEKYLKDLSRTEIEEYCRICVVDSEYNDGNQGAAIDRAVKEAKRRLAEKAAAEGLNIIEYNRKRCDQLNKGAVARERRNGEVVVPVKVEVRHTAKRSDKATSDARAQMVRVAKKEAEEARERETMNSKGDADMAEAMRRSASEQEALEAQKNYNQNSDALPATPGELTTALGQGRSRPNSDVGSVNGSETENLKFHLLDRDTQRVKMERWCKLKPTSQYHTMDREGQKRHVERHIDQLIARQTGAAASKKPKKRSRTENIPSASPARPGVVSAPSPLAVMTRALSTPATTATTSQEPGATLADTVYAIPATPAAPEVAGVQSFSSTESPAACQEVSSAGNTPDVPMVDAPVENTTTPADSSATLPATVETEAVQDEPTQPTPVTNTTDEQRSVFKLYEPPSVEANLKEAAKPSHYEVETDVPMADAPFESNQDSLIQPDQQGLQPHIPSHRQQQLFSTPQNPRIPIEYPQTFMSAPPDYVTPYPTPPSVARSSAPPTRAPAPPAAPAIFQGQDGMKYSVDPSSEFGDLLVNVDRELVDIEDVEYTRQLVLVAKKAPRPPRAKGKEMKWGVEVFRRAGEGVFKGLFVGVMGRVTRVGGRTMLSLLCWCHFKWEDGRVCRSMGFILPGWLFC
ncbi:hypothetical protein ACLOAV_008356 [Pseudogymnoascus australis]